MRHIAKITLFILSFFFTALSFGQSCGTVYDYYISDMTTLDGDNSDGLSIPDGIFNLYDADATLTPSPGDQWFDPNFNFILDTSTGDLNVWGFDKASQTMDDYIFQLRNASGVCMATVRVVVAPYSGQELPSTDGISVELCDSNIFCLEGGITQSEFDIDLYETLISRAGVPPPHLNGKWEYLGEESNEDFTGARIIIKETEINVMGQPQIVRDTTSLFTTTITYKPGGTDRVDEATFDFNYIVPNSISDPLMEFDADTTKVRISMVRQVFSGYPSLYNICESEVDSTDLSSSYLTPENLRDDRYLQDEDLEGQWLIDDATTGGEITAADDASVDFKKLYDDIIADNPRFGKKEFRFSYFVEKRSGVCNTDTSTVIMTLFEELKPFQQNEEPNEFCATRGDDKATFDLFDYLEFTTENGVLFDYTDGVFNDDLVGWSLVSSPDQTSDPDKTLLRTVNEDNELHLGTVEVGNAVPGTYVFRYTVDSNKLIIDPAISEQPNTCSYTLEAGEHPCPDMTADVEIIIHPYDYAGAVTPDPDDPAVEIPEFCESQGTIALVEQLRTTFDNVIATDGNWTDDQGNSVDNEFVIPEIQGQQDFTFTYATANAAGCVDSSTLSIRIYQEPSAGMPANGTVCRESGTFELFSLLTDADQNGFWTGPVGYNSQADLNFDAHLGYMNLLDDTKNWQSGEYKYIVPGNGACTTTVETTVNLTVIEAISVSFNLNNRIFCKEVGQVNLFDFLDNTTSALQGEFTRIDDESNQVMVDGAFVFEELNGGVYRFTYSAANGDCTPVSDDIEIRIIDVPTPDAVSPTIFCILDAATLNDIEEVSYVEADGSSKPVDNVIWYAGPDGDETVSLSTLLVHGQKFYVAAQGENGCESNRIEVTITILNLGEKDCTLEFQDGVAPNSSGDETTFNITEWRGDDFNIPIVFTDFELLIYNRFGTLVYRANKNTEEFRGVGNTGLQLGKNLPSGIYFYVLNPNKDENKPIQGNFYLSK